MTQVTEDDGRNLAQSLAPGETMTLPDGRGQHHLRRRPPLGLAAGRPRPGQRCRRWSPRVLALAGLMLSLFVRRRRVWVRATAADDGRTLVEVAGLARTEGEGLADEV